MSVLSVKFGTQRRALLAALLCAQLIAGVVTVAAVGPSAGGATDDDHTDAVFRSAHAGSCLTWQPEPPQRPAFVQCSSPHLFEVVNAVPFGLTGSIWTRDLNTAHRAARRIQTGYVWINNVSQHFVGAPFGGIKQSGIGREECFAELLEFTQTKNVNVKF